MEFKHIFHLSIKIHLCIFHIEIYHVKLHNFQFHQFWNKNFFNRIRNDVNHIFDNYLVGPKNTLNKSIIINVWYIYYLTNNTFLHIKYINQYFFNNEHNFQHFLLNIYYFHYHNSVYLHIQHILITNSVYWTFHTPHNF